MRRIAAKKWDNCSKDEHQYIARYHASDWPLVLPSKFPLILYNL